MPRQYTVLLLQLSRIEMQQPQLHQGSKQEQPLHVVTTAGLSVLAVGVEKSTKNGIVLAFSGVTHLQTGF
jgi:hypothetical protein